MNNPPPQSSLQNISKPLNTNLLETTSIRYFLIGACEALTVKRKIFFFLFPLLSWKNKQCSTFLWFIEKTSSFKSSLNILVKVSIQTWCSPFIHVFLFNHFVAALTETCKWCLCNIQNSLKTWCCLHCALKLGWGIGVCQILSYAFSPKSSLFFTKKFILPVLTGTEMFLKLRNLPLVCEWLQV